MVSSTFQEPSAQSIDIERAGDAEELGFTQLGLGLISGVRKVYFCAAEFDLQTLHRLIHIADIFLFVTPLGDQG